MALTEEKMPGEGVKTTVSRLARFPGQDGKLELGLGAGLDGDELNLSCDKLMDRHSGKNSVPNVHGCCTENVEHAKDDPDHDHEKLEDVEPR